MSDMRKIMETVNLQPANLKRLGEYVAEFTEANNHTEAYRIVAQSIGARQLEQKFILIQQLQDIDGNLEQGLNDYRFAAYLRLMAFGEQNYGKEDWALVKGNL